MDFITILLIGIGLSMDASAVSLAKGMSLDKDKATGWDKDLFGSTADSVKEGLENLIEYLKLHSTMDQEYDSKQMSFFESLLNKISLLNL